MTEENPWLHDGNVIQEMPEGHEGFVYRITLADGRFYIGQKKINFKRTKVLRGKKKRVTVESDWKTYYGSSEEVKRIVGESGGVGVKREVLHFCKTKGEMNFREAKEIFATDALISSKYLNKWVSVKVSRIHLKHLLLD